MITKEQHEKLEKYEGIFNTAIKANYYRAMDSKFAAQFISTCKELNVFINPSCPQCVLKVLQMVGRMYFDYREPEQPVNTDSSELSVNEDSKTTKEVKKASQNEKKGTYKKKSK